MRWIVLAALLASTPVEAHCYSRWHYPWPQKCGAILRPVRPVRPVLREQREQGKQSPEQSADMPLPSLARADFDGGEADEPTRAKVLLRAALEAPR